MASELLADSGLKPWCRKVPRNPGKTAHGLLQAKHHSLLGEQNRTGHAVWNSASPCWVCPCPAFPGHPNRTAPRDEPPTTSLNLVSGEQWLLRSPCISLTGYSAVSPCSALLWKTPSSSMLLWGVVCMQPSTSGIFELITMSLTPRQPDFKIQSESWRCLRRHESGCCFPLPCSFQAEKGRHLSRTSHREGVTKEEPLLSLLSDLSGKVLQIISKTSLGLAF